MHLSNESRSKHYQIKGQTWFQETIQKELEYYENELENQKLQSNAGQKIQWLGSEVQLIYLFERLFENNFLSHTLKEKRFVTIANHFINKMGKPFKGKQLR